MIGLTPLKLATLAIPGACAAAALVQVSAHGEPDAEVPEAIRERLAEFLNMELYVYETVWEASPEDMQAHAQAHLDYQVELERSGRLFAAGPVTEEGAPRFPPKSGLIVVRASSFEEARAIADADPMHQAGLRSYTLRRWTVNEGSLELKVRFSGQKVDIR